MNPQESPLFIEWRELRAPLPKKTVLVVRLGDFYELFFEDATQAAPVLGVALTKRAGVPMAGFPHHSARTIYIPALLKAGISVAIAEMDSDSKTPKRVVVETLKAPRIIRDR